MKGRFIGQTYDLVNDRPWHVSVEFTWDDAHSRWGRLLMWKPLAMVVVVVQWNDVPAIAIN